jgi:NACalpha-BTF3-like transcription factor
VSETKPLIQQTLPEQMDTVIGEKGSDALMASGGDWVKAIMK